MPTKKELLYLKAKDSYYRGEPIMTDSEFDTLEIELKRENSPITKIVGYQGGKSLKYKHPTKMLSLEKLNIDEEQFDVRLKRFLDKVDTPHIQTTPKFDGNAVNVIYEDGRLIAGITRGDGQFGVNVTHKIRRLVPNRIPIEEKIEVRGEVLIDIPTFEEKFKADFKNPRNFVAGVLNKDNNDVTTLNNLTFIPVDVRIHMDDGSTLYSFLEHPEVPIEKFETEIEYMVKCGFTELPKESDFILDNNGGFKQFKKELNNICKIRDNYKKAEFPYLIDGVVVKFIDPEDRRKLGENSHSPNWALAVKLPAVEKSTIIKSIEWNVGTTGELTPVAVLEPIEVDGSIISRVTLHNYGWMTERKCYPGAVVKIIKSGDIIPKVVEVLKEGSYLDLNMDCPECNSQLIIEGIRLMCTNEDCRAKVIRRLKNSFAALKMDYFGESTCDLLHKAGVKTILDFIDPEFNSENLKNTPHFKDGRFLERIMQQYDKLRDVKLSQLILSLNFNKVGKTIAKLIAKQHQGQDVDWTGVDSEIIERFNLSEEEQSSSEEYNLIDKLITYVKDRGYEITYPKKSNEDTVNFEMTGSPKDHGFKSKAEFKKRLEGFNTQHTNLTNAKYLITDDLAKKSKKTIQAEKKGIEIVTYTDFINILTDK